MASGKREVGALTQAVAAELRAALARRNVSQKFVAGAAEIPSATLGKILRGVSVIDVEQLYRICRAIGVEPQDVVANAVGAAAAAGDEGRVIEGRFQKLGSAREFPDTAVAHVTKRSIFDEQEQRGE